MSETQDREERFVALYRETRDEIMAYLIRRARTMEDAADALSETYAAAWRKLDVLPGGGKARLWLFGAARVELRKAADRALAYDRVVDGLARELEVAHSEHVQAVDFGALWAAVSSLQDRDREILTLTAWEGLAPREIAVVLGVSANVVRVRLHRTRRDLQTALGREPRLRTQAAGTAG